MASLVVYSASGDGYIESGNVTYATMLSGSALSADTTDQLRAGQMLETGTYYGFIFYLDFDTSALGAGATVSAAVLDLFLNDDDAVAAFTTAVAALDWSSGGLTTADWQNTSALAALTEVATRASAGVGAGYNAFTDTGAGLASIVNKTGHTYIVGWSTRMEAGTTPTLHEHIIWEGGGAGASPSPRLTITYTAVTTTTVRPDADTTTTGWTATPLWSKIEESSADGTVVTATAA
jgi:hypothetical protein